MSNQLHAHKLEGMMVITSPEDGALALAMAVIQNAVDDLRLHIKPPVIKVAPERRTDRTKRISARQASVRRAHARQAAAFLQGEDGRWWLTALEACGAPVPMNRLFRQLQHLKQRQPAKEAA